MQIAEPVARAVRQAVPTFEPVGLREAKKQVAVAQSIDLHDEQLGFLIKTAREKVEHDTGIIASTGSFVLALDCWPYSEDFLKIRERPITSITSIAYLDTAGASQTWSSANYAIDTARNVIWRAYDVSWPDTRSTRNAVTVTFVAGYSTPLTVMQRFKQAMLLFIQSEWTGTRENEPAYEALIASMMRNTYP